MSSALAQPEKLSEWNKITVGEAFETVTGNTPSKSRSEYYGDFVPFVKPPELRDGEIRSATDNLSESGADVGRVLPPDSLLVSCIGNLGKIGIANTPVAFNQQINAIKPAFDRAIPRFMFFQALSPNFQEQLQSLSSGTTVPIVNKSKFNSLNIVLPPLPEQERIVAILDEAFAGIATATAHAGRNLHNARELFQSVLLQAVTGELTKEWRGETQIAQSGFDDLKLILNNRRQTHCGNRKYIEPNPPITDGLFPIPDSWTWSNLDQLKKFSLYGPRFSKDDYSSEGVLVLRTSDINEHGRVNSETAPRLKMEPKDFENYKCVKGDLLITRTGSLGTLAVFSDETDSIPGAYLIQYRLLNSEVAPWYLFMFFKSSVGQLRLTGGATGSGRPNLNVPTIEAIQIPFPPFAEQKAIVQKLDALSAETRRLEAVYQRKLDALAELKQSLLQRAFAGEL